MNNSAGRVNLERIARVDRTIVKDIHDGMVTFIDPHLKRTTEFLLLVSEARASTGAYAITYPK